MNQPKPTSFLDFMRQKSAAPGETGEVAPAPQPKRIEARPAPVPAPGQLPGLGARPRSEPIGLIVTVFLCLSVVAGILCFVIGKRIGREGGLEEGLARRSSQELRSVEDTLREPFAPQARPAQGRPATAVDAGLALPVEAKPLPRETLPNTARTAETASFTLQVQSFGRHQQETTRDLVQALKNKGFDAHANLAEGVVYVGRFSSPNSPEAKKAKSAVQTFQWKKRNFQGCVFVNMPKYTSTGE